MDLESEAVDNPDAFHVYADSCLVCNQQCYLRPSYPSDNNSRLAESERERIVEIRGIIYQAFDIQVGKDFLEENRSELPLCPKCTFKLGQLRHVHFQLAALQREYNKLREDIAFSIVDLVAGSEGSKSYLADIGSKSPNSFLQCMKESEVDTIQHLVFENWHERYSEDDLAEESKLEIELPNLKTAESKQAPLQKPSTSQNAGGKSKQDAAAPSIVDSQTVIKSKSVPPPSSASTSIKAIANSSASNSGTTLKSDITPNTKVISITTATDTTQASVEVSSEDLEVNDIKKRRARTDALAVDSGQDDGNMIIAMSPTQFCGTSECSSPDPSSFLQEIDNSENEMDAGDEEDLPFKLRQFEKIKVEQSGAQYSKSLKFPNDLEITEWSSDESQQRGLDYDIFDNDDGSQDLEGMLDESGNRIRGMNREGDVTVDNNSLGNIEFQQNEEGLYVCMFCSKTFIHKYPYRDHLKTHTGEGPRCPLCNKIFPKNHNLMLHMRTHTGEKPYKCLVCGKGFADKSNLKVHMRVHTGERPYKCEYCDQAFVNSSRLVVHRRLHTGEKPFVCDLCNRCFGTGNQLATHRKIHYEEKNFKCDECGKGYNSAVTLQAHVTLAH